MNESFGNFERDGYVMLRGAILQPWLDELKRHLRLLVAARECQSTEGAIMEAEARNHKEVYEAGITVGSSLSAYALINGARLESHATKLLGEGAHHVTPLHVSIQIPRNTEFDYAWHIESDFYPWAPEILNFWFPIMATTQQHKTGTIEVIPGSHLNEQRKHVKTNEGGYVQIVSDVEQVEEQRGIQIEAEPGDLLIFHKHMVHRTCPNLSNVPRVTGIIRVIDMAKLSAPRPLYKALAYVQ